MANIKIFESDEFGEIRTVTIENDPWFVGKDIAMALGYGDTDQAVRKHVQDEDKLPRQIDGGDQKRAWYDRRRETENPVVKEVE